MFRQRFKGLRSRRIVSWTAVAVGWVTAVIARVVRPAADERVRVTDDSWRHPMADEPAVRRVIEYPLRMNRGRHDLEVVTAVGRHLVVRRPDGDDVFVLDPAPLFGLWLDIGDHGSDEIAIQDSLF